MKKLIITEEEKNSILNKYFHKKVLNEQKQFLAKLFGSSVDDIFKNFGDDAVKGLDDIFAKVFTKPGNLVLKSGEQFLKSASGSEIPMKTIRDAIQLVSQGKLQPSQVANYLPRNLADGTEFRTILTNALENKGSKIVGQNAGKVASKLALGKVGQDFKQMASQIGGWLQVKYTVGNMSGWKFHVYADNLDEAAFLYEKLLPVASKHGAGMKVASSQMLERLSQNAVQKGKGVTLYLPSSVVAKKAEKEFLNDVQSAIKGYESSGQISGDKMITKNIGYRYELSQPVDPTKGVDMKQYTNLYKSNEGGAHNIEGNLDLFK